MLLDRVYMLYVTVARSVIDARGWVQMSGLEVYRGTPTEMVMWLRVFLPYEVGGLEDMKH